MTGRFDPVAWLSGVSHPRLALVSVLGAVLGIVGVTLFLLSPVGGPDVGTTGLRLAIAGAILLLFGSTGYLAFAFFERAEH